MSPNSRPIPAPDEVTAPYWEAAAAHRLVLSRCQVCGTFEHPRSAVCGSCHSTAPNWQWVEVSGAGKVRSWTTMRSSFLPGLGDDVPFVLVDVELDAQDELRLIGRLLDGPDATVVPDARVVLGFEDIADGISVPAWRLEEGA